MRDYLLLKESVPSQTNGATPAQVVVSQGTDVSAATHTESGCCDTQHTVWETWEIRYRRFRSGKPVPQSVGVLADMKRILEFSVSEVMMVFARPPDGGQDLSNDGTEGKCFPEACAREARSAMEFHGNMRKAQ